MYNKRFTKKPTQNQIVGHIGEELACKYLEDHAYKIVDRNYLKKWGEIDIVATKLGRLHFVEVKTVSRDSENSVTHVTDRKGEYRPEDNMHPWKLKRLSRAVESYLLEKDIPETMEWQFDVATVTIDPKRHISNVLLLEDIVL